MFGPVVRKLTVRFYDFVKIHHLNKFIFFDKVKIAREMVFGVKRNLV